MNTSPKEALSPAALFAVYRKALLINLVDERIRSLLSSGRLAAAYYSPRGQEIVAAAMGVHLETSDYLVTMYRGIHDQLAKGMPLRQLCAEYYGKATGTCKGKGGPMHITYPAAGIMVTTGVVGGGLPIANGLALASKLRKDKRVTVCTFGDGAANIGAFHESLNMASLWKLPVIFLCQNNGYGECTKFEYATSVPHIADRAVAYSMPASPSTATIRRRCGTRCVKRSSARAAAAARPCSKRTPFASWVITLAIPGAYIPKEQYAAALARDPMPACRAAVLSSGAATEAQLKTLAAEITADLDDALKFAAESPCPMQRRSVSTSTARGRAHELASRQTANDYLYRGVSPRAR